MDDPMLKINLLEERLVFIENELKVTRHEQRCLSRARSWFNLVGDFSLLMIVGLQMTTLAFMFSLACLFVAALEMTLDKDLPKCILLCCDKTETFWTTNEKRHHHDRSTPV